MTLQLLKRPNKCVFNLFLLYYNDEFHFYFSPLFYIAYQVNLDAETRLITLTKIQSNISDPYAFDRAQRRIQYMMERDSYLRFLQSGLFLELAYPERYQRLRILTARSHCVVSIVSLCQLMFSNNIMQFLYLLIL